MHAEDGPPITQRTSGLKLSGAAAAGRRRHFFLGGLLLADSGSGATMELGRSALLNDAAPAGERSEVRGHRQQIGKFAALTISLALPPDNQH